MLITTNHNQFLPRQSGFTLIELMVGILVGLIVLSSAIAIYLMGVRGGTYTVRAAKLNQQMRTGMNIMVDDIRRAGYWGDFAQGTANPFTARTGAPITDIHILSFNGVSNACILYSYDATYQDDNHIGTPIGDTSDPLDPDPKGADFFGFRLGTNGTLQIKQGGTTTNDCTADQNNWESITDENSIVIEVLTFDTVDSQCMNSTGVIDATTGQRVPVDWQVTTANTATPACEDTTATGYQAPNDDDHLVELRQINIRMRARHVSDASLRAELSESVKVRNDRVFTFVTPGP